jgi:hypothetical protein
MKKCSNCFQTKPLEDFYVKRDKNANKNKVYRQSRCKECNPEVCAGYRERARWNLEIPFRLDLR